MMFALEIHKRKEKYSKDLFFVRFVYFEGKYF
jgi:hypothetical protein